MNNAISLLDVVALTEDILDSGIAWGQVGTVVEELGMDTFLVEFSDDDGHTYAMLPLAADQLIVLYYAPNESQPASA